ncbi:MAG: ParB/RepB/Spo0J family partition protein [Succinivibrionaceae bacterium]|nr:ParB/RepB/Spo0J family partition protein [Ruminobacter sp.]MDD7381898.1 ParB/RepB/Spo0J family partition protein [Bacillales bacterium]MDY5780107.1 ParB/RepB/Spo0J family partition protein [Succinivibrionaceae bacterium]MEE1339795.1 ParB/RepB/Spo0J family partition protein [Succinivibrionaceae bacterium]
MAGLGKGLGALLSNNLQNIEKNNQNENFENDNSNSIKFIDINNLQRGQYQPRNEIDLESVSGLAESIASQGIIEPIIVRRIGNDIYEIVAGERRWKAAQKVGLKEIPCIIKEISDDDAMVIALLENIQREDLNVIEEAQALQLLINKLSITHEELAKKIGKSRSSITNLIRLNELDNDVKEFLRRGDLEMGHARSLLSLPKEQQSKVALIIIQKGLTVRETEQLVSKLLKPNNPKTKEVPEEVRNFNEYLKNKFGGLNFKYTNNGKNKGKLVLNFNNEDELNRIKQLLNI